MVRWDGDDWLSGLAFDWDIDTASSTVSKGFATADGIDPFRRPGYAMPGTFPIDITTVSVIDAIQKNAAVYLQYAFTVGGTKMHQLDLTNNTLTNNATFPKTVSAHGGHNSVSASDIILYYIGTTRYGFYSWSDNADGDVGRYDLATTFDDDYMSTVAASGAVLSTTYAHPMVVGADDILYIADGRKLHGFDGQTGANGTFSAARLTLPTDYIITSFAKTGDRLVIFAYKASASYSNSKYRSEATAFFWDYVSEDTDKVVPLNSNYVNGGFSYKGTIGCFTQGQAATLNADKQSRLVLFTGSVFEPLVAFVDDIPGFGGVEVCDNTIYWNSEGKIYQYGSPHIGMNNVMNRVSALAGTTGEGMLKNLSNNNLIGSAGTTTSGGLQRMQTGYYPASFSMPFVDIPTPYDKYARITKVRVHWYRTTEASCNTINLNLQYDGGAWGEDVIEESGYVGNSRQSPPANPAPLISLYETTYNAKSFSLATSVSVNVTYTASNQTKRPAIIKSIEVYYTYENI